MRVPLCGRQYFYPLPVLTLGCTFEKVVMSTGCWHWGRLNLSAIRPCARPLLDSVQVVLQVGCHSVYVTLTGLEGERPHRVSSGSHQYPQ